MIVTVMLGGKERRLNPELALRLLKDELGVDDLGFYHYFANPENQTFSAFGHFLWAMIDEEPKPTERDVLRWVDFHNFQEIGEAMKRAMHRPETN